MQAIAVGTDHDGVHDLLRVSVSVVSARPGKVTLGFRITDASGWRITSTLRTVTVRKGAQQVTADLSGYDIGDAGASGVAALRVTARPVDTTVECADVVLPATSIGPIDASTFAGWTTSLERLRERLQADIVAGQVSGTAATRLPKTLHTPAASAPDLAAFRRVLAVAQVVSAQERVRLDSLAQRLQSPAAAAPPAAELSAVATPTDSSSDGVG